MKIPLLIAIALAGSVSASLAELSPSEQQSLAKKLGEKVQRFEMGMDDEGNVTSLVFINHQALTKEVGEKPGITDEDLGRLGDFPHLEALTIEAQGVGDAGLEVLRNRSGMKQIGFHYMAKHPDATATPDCAAVIDGKPDLEILEIKHNFKMDAFAIESIATPMPKVWRLVLDTPITAEQTLHLVRLCPNVRDIQLHRTRLSAEQLAEVGKLLPELEVLWWKPKGGLEAEHLVALKSFPKLRIFSPQHYRNQVPYEGGWNALLEVPSLERVETSIGDDENGTALKKLLELRPGLEIDGKLTRSRNYNGL